VLCANSCPPLNPIAKSRYNEINLLELLGISKSLLRITAITPPVKKITVWGWLNWRTKSENPYQKLKRVGLIPKINIKNRRSTAFYYFF
jgi:hypothetical protein